MEVETPSWEEIHKSRKDEREKQWMDVLEDLNKIAIITHVRNDHYVIHLPDLGKCDFYVRADKLKVHNKDGTRLNAFKKILKQLDLYMFDGKLLEK